MNDERDIVTAIDRNTKSIDRLYEALLKIVLHLIWIGVKGVWRCPLK